MSATPRLALPFLIPGQAQKELFHNEALQSLDILVAAAVEAMPTATPPASPVIGNCYIIAGGPTGAWSGHAQQLAGYTSGGWRFLAPRDGMTALVRSNGKTAVYAGGLWEIGTLHASKVMIDGLKVLGARAAAIGGPASGSTVDAEARTAIGLILAAMRAHGLIEV
jgi:Protein of unknown function (DUF2793)